MTPDRTAQRTYAIRYGIFLQQVDRHLPNGLDSHVLGWFLGPGKIEVSALSAEAWDTLIVVLLYLSMHGALRTTTILKGLVYPAWELGSVTAAQQFQSSTEPFLQAANTLCRQLLLNEAGSGDVMPPSDLLDLQGLRTRRQEVYRQSHFCSLLYQIPILVMMENNPRVPEELRGEVNAIRVALCERTDFRTAVFRNLEAVRQAFESVALPGDSANSNLDKELTTALRIVLCETADGNSLHST
jgi:mediator of RNA polymerase II transcription subunit 12